MRSATMGCGCAKSGTLRRVPRAAGVVPGVGVGVRQVARRVDGHCCAACAIGAPCGSRVQAAGFYWGPGVPERRETVIRFGGAERAAGDSPRCERRAGESVAGYQARCGLERTGMDAELWGTMDAAERRQWLRDTSREAGIAAREEQRLIGSAISGGFDTLREIIRTIRDVRIEEIRSGARVQIASIRGLSAREREYLENWGDEGQPPTTQPPPPTTQPPSSSGSGGVVAIGGLALLAKLAGVW